MSVEIAAAADARSLDRRTEARGYSMQAAMTCGSCSQHEAEAGWVLHGTIVLGTVCSTCHAAILAKLERMIADARNQGDDPTWDAVPLVREAFKDNREESPHQIAGGWGRFLRLSSHGLE